MDFATPAFFNLGIGNLAKLKLHEHVAESIITNNAQDKPAFMRTVLLIN